MRLTLVPTFVLGLGATFTVTAAPSASRSVNVQEIIASLQTSNDANEILTTVQSLVDVQLRATPKAPRAKCTVENAVVRRDWENMSKCERKDYIEAVKCLWRLPSIDTEFSAAQNHFDDYVAVHMNLTNFIHGTANFLPWHRYLIYLWEQKLRNQCGYRGHLPYWNWFKYQDDLSQSPVFDGSATSLGGDGEYFAHNGSVVGSGRVWLPSGKGGGCIKEGPFQGFNINLGPVQPAMQGYSPVYTDVKHLNTRCPRRDLTMAASTSTFTAANLVNLTVGPASSSIGAFQDELQGPLGTLRIHGAGHYSMGGDGSDVFTSLNDPAFYLHHAMIDRLYWIWQVLHPAEANKLNGTVTFRNNPPSQPGTVEDLLEVGKLGPHLAIKNVLDTTAGDPLCYIYA